MTLFAPRDRSHVRSRLVRTALATTAAAACALGVATPSPALARDGGSIPDAFAQRRPAPHVDQRRDYATPDPTFRALTPAAGAAELGAKLGDRDLRTLQAAEVKGKQTVTVLLAVTPGDTGKVSQAVERLDGSVGRAEEELGYVRATVPVDAVRGLAALGDVRAIDLNRTYRVPDPHVTLNGSASVKARRIAAPGATTGADNPYLPVGETGAVDFVDHHRTWDGRGITVGILDTGVDLDHPALRTTTNGRDKVTDWFTATDPVIDNDGTWLQMDQEKTGPTFFGLGEQWTAPEGDYRFAVFFESTTEGSELGGDVNRDGDTDDWVGVLYDPADHRIWVDSDLDHDFTDEQVMSPYRADHQVGHFGVDDRSTPVVERVPFVVDYREDVDLSAAGLPRRRRLREPRHRQRVPRHPRRGHHRGQRPLRRRHAGGRARRPDRVRACLHVQRRLYVDRAGRGHDRPRPQRPRRRRQRVHRRAPRPQRRLRCDRHAVRRPHRHHRRPDLRRRRQRGPRPQHRRVAVRGEPGRERRGLGQQGDLARQLRRPGARPAGDLRVLVPRSVGERRTEADAGRPRLPRSRPRPGGSRETPCRRPATTSRPGTRCSTAPRWPLPRPPARPRCSSPPRGRPGPGRRRRHCARR